MTLPEPLDEVAVWLSFTAESQRESPDLIIPAISTISLRFAPMKWGVFGMPGNRTDLGKIAEQDLRELDRHFEHIGLVRYAVMPNHIHAIIRIGCDCVPGKRPNLNTVVGLYKSGVTRKIRKLRPEITVWQRSFHDHIIRNDVQFRKIWEYIENNPLQWELDCYYSEI